MGYQVSVDCEAFLVAWFGVPRQGGGRGEAGVMKEDEVNKFDREPRAAGGFVRSAKRMKKGLQEFVRFVRLIFG